MSYKDQVVLITGGASGIGKASVIEFAKEGAKVIFADIQKEISGVVKITDGNERAIPISILNIFKKLKVMSRVELKNLEKKEKFVLQNHAGRNIGRINLTMK